MKALRRFLAAMRMRLGFGGLSETRLSPAHGWLLPQAPKPPGMSPGGLHERSKT